MHFCWVLFHKPGFELDQAATILTEQGLQVERQTKALLVNWHRGPTLRVSFASSQDVQNEASDKVVGSSYEQHFQHLNARFEIAFDDLDEVLKEINTLIETQLTLQNATKGFLWNSWNDQISPPEQ